MKVETGEIQADKNSFLSKITNKSAADKFGVSLIPASLKRSSSAIILQHISLVVGLTACLEMTFQLLSWLKRFPLRASPVSGDLVTLAEKISTTAYVLFMP